MAIAKIFCIQCSKFRCLPDNGVENLHSVTLQILSKKYHEHIKKRTFYSVHYSPRKNTENLSYVYLISNKTYQERKILL